MVLEPVLENELFNIVLGLKESSAGWDCINGSIIKHVYKQIKEPLCHVLNLSFSSGVFPSELKIARVVPLYK